MSSYSVYQLSEGTEHNAFVECESEEGLLLLDPNGDAYNANGVSRGSYMTGLSRGMTGINDNDNDHDFDFEEGKSYD